MKKFCIIFLLSFIIILTAVGAFSGCSVSATVNDRYLRIHIRADSDGEQAQTVKYAVRDEVVALLTPIVAQADGFERAETLVRENLSEIERASNAVLRGQGFNYTAKAALKREQFPTRKYGEYTLEAGEYLALVIELGSGRGQNWWCVVYPPLCFAGQANTPVVYKSKILEIIERWKGE